jgi:hypothetical protein
MPTELWRFFPVGYLVTILIEAPILLIGLSRRHSFAARLFAGVWLTACTYPIVTLVLPLLFVNESRLLYLAVAESFAPIAECVLFWLAFGSTKDFGSLNLWRDFAVITVANLVSFGLGEILNVWKWFGWF